MQHVLLQQSYGRGRGLFLDSNMAAGQVAIEEEACALWICRSFFETECAWCLRHRTLNEMHEKDSNWLICTSCCRVVYCSRNCRSSDVSHDWICSQLQKITENMDEESESCLLLCLHVVYLHNQDTKKYNEVMNQAAITTQLDSTELNVIHHVSEIFQTYLSQIEIATPAWIETVFKKDKACGFAIMQPPCVRFSSVEKNSKSICEQVEEDEESKDHDDDNDDEDDDDGVVDNNDDDEEEKEEDVKDKAEEDADVSSLVRGYSVLPLLGLMNHSCMPNCIRWDNFDHSPLSLRLEMRTPKLSVPSLISPEPDINRRVVYFRTLYPLEQGQELFQSYVPLGWDLADRREYLKEMFGFDCDCFRCSTEMKAEVLERKKNTNKEKKKKSSTVSKEQRMNLNYVNLYLSRHLCPQNVCTGTLTPVIGFSEDIPGLDVYECNVCGFKRSHDEFIASIS
jgi:hypothetical protein